MKNDLFTVTQNINRGVPIDDDLPVHIFVIVVKSIRGDHSKVYEEHSRLPEQNS